ncbi:hypothetical protein [Ammoniphilus sp. CFH 90114]|uniref:hypothetical protein n=1 Tax=Ammoniphilus sp. CFH 90114 TaxID=2493665 RepID=UPI00196AAF06|nr:hypothetical protein [Ammoniphilus sp. CFH 90114]
MAEEPKHSLLSTEQIHLHSRTLEEFPEGPYGSTLLTENLGKSSGWDTGEENEQRFGYEFEQLHTGLPRLDPAADPIRYKGDGTEEETQANYEKQ